MGPYRVILPAHRALHLRFTGWARFASFTAGWLVVAATAATAVVLLIRVV